MSTTYEMLASQLPAELRGDFADDVVLKVTVGKSRDLPMAETELELRAMLKEAEDSLAAGKGITLHTREDRKAFFEKIVAEVHQEYNLKTA